MKENSKFKIGIVGYGGFGKFLHASWSDMENVEIVAVADENPDCIPPEEDVSFESPFDPCSM